MDVAVWSTILSAGLLGTIGAIGWLIKTVISNASKVDGLATKEDLNAHREKVAENYVRRDDYVPQITQMNVKLDAIGGMVARLDERSREDS